MRIRKKLPLIKEVFDEALELKDRGFAIDIIPIEFEGRMSRDQDPTIQESLEELDALGTVDFEESLAGDFQEGGEDSGRSSEEDKRQFEGISKPFPAGIEAQFGRDPLELFLFGHSFQARDDVRGVGLFDGCKDSDEPGHPVVVLHPTLLSTRVFRLVAQLLPVICLRLVLLRYRPIGH
ncbi:hypothetical protein PGTUg99_032149 [Puccinia graminis f. sp. tritici]|uniref:Uncharacterized protein n=1 Tax=Puccinia graminis f. sp. tritici TaxID=56615 RepID=A0A5B0LV99_PUCGR|nr:hypothetical protein PGTUg99_032149 [Puccinia graminis f. sp. tritici]